MTPAAPSNCCKPILRTKSLHGFGYDVATSHPAVCSAVVQHTGWARSHPRMYDHESHGAQDGSQYPWLHQNLPRPGAALLGLAWHTKSFQLQGFWSLRRFGPQLSAFWEQLGFSLDARLMRAATARLESQRTCASSLSMHLRWRNDSYTCNDS